MTVPLLGSKEGVWENAPSPAKFCIPPDVMLICWVLRIIACRQGERKKKPLGKSWAPYTTMLPTVAKREMGNAGRREDGGCIILGGKRQRGDGKGEKGEDGRNDRIKYLQKLIRFAFKLWQVGADSDVCLDFFQADAKNCHLKKFFVNSAV